MLCLAHSLNSLISFGFMFPSTARCKVCTYLLFTIYISMMYVVCTTYMHTWVIVIGINSRLIVIVIVIVI